MQEISIHLMFLLIVFRLFVKVVKQHFNTSHVSINRGNALSSRSEK